MIWVDVTDLLVWRGTFTGIQRVTYEYAIRLEKDGAKFFAFDYVENRFFEVKLSALGQVADVDSVIQQVPRISRRRRIRQVLGAPYYRLSDEKKAFLHPYVVAANHTVRSMLHVALKARSDYAPKLVVSEYHEYPQAVFNNTDTVVLLGAGWNTPALLQKLVELRAERGFRLSQHINDILPIYQPQLFADGLPEIFEEYMTIAVKNADIITVISKATQRDVKTYCRQHGVTKPIVRVVRLGDNPEVADAAKQPAGVAEDEKFILAVGTFEVRKNYQLLYQAVKLAQIESRSIPRIVIAGRPGWLSADLRHMIQHDPHASRHIVWLSDVSDAELKWLYGHCMFTVFPSVAEGWGLPIAESLQNGKFCLTSGLSSMLEIGEGLVDYFLPYDARECLAKIEYYLAENRYREMNAKVASSYRVFTWDESYRQLLSAIKK